MTSTTTTRSNTLLTSEYITGLLFIVLVALIWAGSSLFTQFIYNSNNGNFHSPFWVTYMGTSLFTLWLPIQKITTLLRYYCTYNNDNTKFDINSNDNNNNNENSTRINTTVEYETLESTITDTTLTTDDNVDDDEDVVTQQQQQQWTDIDHFYVAIKIAPVWFIANWTYNASLAYTSITSSTVLASTGSLFTFIFAICTKDEQYNYIKLIGVLLGMTGSIITAFHDSENDNSNNNNEQKRYLTRILFETLLNNDNTDNDNNNNNNNDDDNITTAAFWGDLLGLISAVGYGGYAVQTRVYCPKDESIYSMQKLLGYIGLLNMICLSPIAIIQSKMLTWNIIICLVIKGLFDNVLSDYLWLRAVMLTNATVATVGLGLTIPLAFISDIMFMNDTTDVLNIGQIFGALGVLAGFVMVNIGNRHNNDNTTTTNNNNNNNNIHYNGQYHDNIDDEEQPECTETGQEVVDLSNSKVIL